MEKSPQEAEKCPKQVFLITAILFLERFCYYGIRTGLVIFMLWEMDFSLSNSIVMSHLFVIIYCLSTILENFLHYTISSFVISWIGILFNIVGFTFMIVPHKTSIQENNDKAILDTLQYAFYLCGLLFISIGTGLARPGLIFLSTENLNAGNKGRCLSLVNASGLVAGLCATLIVPPLRNIKISVETLFVHLTSLIFTIVIVSASVCHIIGSFSLYKRTKSKELQSIALRSSVKTFRTLLRQKSKTVSNQHILLFFIPLIIIWSLLEQNFTYFVLQSFKSDRHIFSYKIQAAQVMALHPFFLIIFLFLNKHIFHRAFDALHFSTPLQKVIVGCLIGLGAYVSAFYFEFELNKSGPIIPKNDEAHFRMFNAMKCDYVVETFIKDHRDYKLKHMEMYQNTRITLEKKLENFWYSIKLDEESWEGNPDFCPSLSGDFQLRKGKAMGYLIEYINASEIGLLCFEDDLSRSKDLRPKVRILGDTINEREVKIINQNGKVVHNTSSYSLDQFYLLPGEFMLTVDDISISESEIELKESEVYVLMILEADNQHDFQLTVMTSAPNVTVLKIIPQFVLLTLSESIITENYQNWILNEIPHEIKPLVASIYFVTIILGNLLIIVVEQLPFIDGEWHFGLFAILMALNICLLVFLMAKLKKVLTNAAEPSSSTGKNVKWSSKSENSPESN